MSTYASIADLLNRRDERLIGQLGTDRDEPLTHDEILASTVIAELGVDASGEVEAAMIAGARYSPDQLSGLTGNSLGLLKKVVCTVWMAALFERRPGKHRDVADFYFKQAQEYLERLRSGQNLFNLADLSNFNAALPENSGPTAFDSRMTNTFATQMSDRYFLSPESRVPRDR